MDQPLARMLGADAEVDCLDGRTRRYVDLDNAASTPVLEEVWQAVAEFAPLSSSVHRGSGFKSRFATAAYEDARAAVGRFVGSRRSDGVALVRNTTEAINVLSAALPPGTRVLSSPAEHHANMLPWRRHDVRLLPFPRSVDELLATAEEALRRERIGLVAVTGASNVTGEIWPAEELAALAHRHGARLFVDAAQLAPHRTIDMAASAIDLLAFSGHKLYAPFGAGALVGDLAWLHDGAPLLQGGGAVDLVTEDEVIWLGAPERYEAGSPNVIGAVALGAACEHLRALGMERVAAHERALASRLWGALVEIDGLETYTLWPRGSADRVGVATFNLAGCRHALLAAVLSAEHAIGVRHGCFCAHPLVARLLDLGDEQVAGLHAALHSGARPPLPGAVRASIGLGTTAADIDRLAAALHEIARNGPAAVYAHDLGRDEYLPRSLGGTAEVGVLAA